MGFGEAISSGFGNYVNFSGRAVRSEYWYWALFTIVGGIVANIVDLIAFGGSMMGGGAGIVDVLFSLATLLPSIAVSVRRLHDTDRSGWWLLLALIPIIGWIVLIVWYCTPGTPGANRFGSPRVTMGSAMPAHL